MLGLTRAPARWNWAACGKHPVVKDFFRIGEDIPVHDLFSGWVDKGFNALGTKQGSGGGPVAWRFWARGRRKDDLVCGLVRDSSDSMGRPYPLLIMGVGPLSGWEDQWDLLPPACERTWSGMENIFAHRASDLKIMDTEVRNTRPPSDDWVNFQMTATDAVRQLSAHDSSGSPFVDMKRKVDGLAGRSEGFIPLDMGGSYDNFKIISSLLHLLKNESRQTPNAVFVGGTFEKSYLVFFKRPLVSSDFVDLWSIPSRKG